MNDMSGHLSRISTKSNVFEIGPHGQQKRGQRRNVLALSFVHGPCEEHTSGFGDLRTCQVTK